jgi:hypothetical protein
MPQDEDYEALARDTILGPEDEEAVPPNRRSRPRIVVDNAKLRRSRVPASEEFSRTWWRWFDDPRFRRVFPPCTRLWLLLWYRSGEGQEPVRLTRKVAADARIQLNRLHEYARQLTTAGLIRIARTGRSEFEVTILARRP